MKLLKTSKFHAPPIEVPDWSGEPLALGSLRDRVILIDFFSLGDPGGVRSFSWIRELADHYADLGLVVLGVHVPAYDFERRAESARRELWRLGVPWPVALDHAFETFRAWGAKDLPARALVDGQGFLRGWQRGSSDPGEIESAIRCLLHEASPEMPIPPSCETETPAGRARWLPSPELRFGTRGVGFGDDSEEGKKGGDSTERTFEELPDLRAEGRPYLSGRWSVHRDRIVLEGDDGILAVVFEGASVTAIVSREDTVDEAPVLELGLDGATPDAAIAGADLELDEPVPSARLVLDRGGVRELISAVPFGVHNLEIRVRGRGAAFHGIEFGTTDVPDVP